MTSEAGPPVVAVAGGKGGVGKTTTALGVALAGARLGARVLALDADVDVPNLHRLAGVDPREGSPEPQPVPGVERARVLPARAGERPRAPVRRLREHREYGAVVVDCAAGAGEDVARPLAAADEVVLVTTPAAPALTDAAKTAAMARAVGTPVAGAVVTRTRSAPEAAADLLGLKPVDLWPVPAADAPLSESRVRRRYETVARRTSVLERPQTL